WHGLTCNEGGQITKIELDTNGLTGSFPPETALLKETLITIDLYNNIVHNADELEGTIPSEIGNLSKLASFSTANCGLSGSIPSEIGSMTNMIQLWLNDNKLTGAIPSELGNSVSTKILKLHNNELVGDMP
ncbi:L domain-like protein, partial [Fragilariopsis cylindrus CCMP1102]